MQSGEEAGRMHVNLALALRANSVARMALLRVSGADKRGMTMTQDNRSQSADQDRRNFIQTAGKLAVIVPPAMTVLLSTSMSSPAIALSGGRLRGNNGLGNGQDGPPPGNPPVNDGPGTGPGNPGNKGGGKIKGNGKP